MVHTISIIIPIYNMEAYLSKCLDSVLAQTYPHLQIICVNDSSRDRSQEILDEYAQKDPRIQVIHKTKNEGVSFARNDGLALATGEYLLFVDGDDWIEPDTCATALETLEQQNADLVMWSYIREVGSDSRPKRIFDSDRIFDAEQVRNQLYRRMAGAYGDELKQPENADALCTVWGKLYRRDLIEDHRIRFPDIRRTGTYEDGLFNLEVMAHVRRAVFRNKHLYHYRRSLDGSLSTAYKSDLPQKWQYMFSLIREHIHRNELDKTFSQALANRIALSMIPLGINEAENPAGAAAVVRGLRGILRDEEYRSALHSLDISPMPIHWKCYFLCARWGWTWGLYALLNAIQNLRGR